MRKEGRFRRGGDGTWVVDGDVAQPRRCLLVLLPDEPGHVELVLGEAADVLAQAAEPIDLIVADPPWALGRGRAGAAYGRTYRRDASRVVGGYVEVDPGAYAEFTARWMVAAADALRPGGCLAVVTGAQQAARVQVIGEDEAGLTYVNSVAVQRDFGLYTTRRFVHAHNTVTLLTKGPLDSVARFFERPDDLGRGRSGEVYAVDVWNGRPRRAPPQPAALRQRPPPQAGPSPRALLHPRRRRRGRRQPRGRSVRRQRHHGGRVLARGTALLRRRPEPRGPALHHGPPARRGATRPRQAPACRGRATQAQGALF